LSLRDLKPLSSILLLGALFGAVPAFIAGHYLGKGQGEALGYIKGSFEASKLRTQLQECRESRRAQAEVWTNFFRENP
jgi:hypothetical protein